MKVLFVCLGNICRSPLAEAIFISKIKEKGLESDFEGSSCGTSNYHIGESPDPRTLRNASKNGIEIKHLGRQLTDEDLAHYDLIVAMDKSNHGNIMRLKNASRYAGKIVMMRDFDPLGNGDVPDPWSGGEREFQDVFDMLDRSIDGLISHLSRKEHEVRPPNR